MRRILRELTNVSYGSAKFFGLSKLAFQAYHGRDREPLLVFSMGKVGTSTVAHSLKSIVPKVPVYHIHTLCEDRIKQQEEVYKKHFRQLRTIHGHLLNSLFLHHRICRMRRDGIRWKVVTLVRDPIARNVSAFFQSLKTTYADCGFAERIAAGGDDKLLSDMTRFFVEEVDHNRALSWFDREIKQVFGVDVLAQNFHVDKGFKIYSGDYADILVIRLEDLDRCAANAFRQFLGLDGFTVIKEQLAGQKYYSDVYRQFRAQLTLPTSVLDSVYRSRLAERFYSPQEIKTFRAKWEESSAVSSANHISEDL